MCVVILGARRNSEPAVAQLAKEIQLKHRAPVVSIDIIDASCAAVGNPFSSDAEHIAPHRVVISSEEQFKVSDPSGDVDKTFLSSSLP